MNDYNGVGVLSTLRITDGDVPLLCSILEE